MPKSRSKHYQESQSARFIEAARELGADEDEAHFREKLATIARQKPKDTPPAPEPPKKAPKPKR